MKPEPPDYGLVLEYIRFSLWVLGGVCSGACFLVGYYLKTTMREALHEYNENVKDFVETHYVRKDLHDEQMRGLRAMIEGGQA